MINMLKNLWEYRSLIGNVVGIIAVFSGLGIYSHNDRKKVLTAKFVADSIWAIHFMLIGATTGALLNVVNIIRDYIFFNKGKKRYADSVLWIVVFILLNLASGAASYEGLISLIPITGSSLAVFGLWLSDSHKMRIISFFAIGLWFVYAGITHSIPSFVYNGFALASIIFGLIKDFRQSKAKDSNDANC